MAENSEQWKGEGDCRKCRREKYCKTACRAHERYRQTIIGRVIRDQTGLDELERQIALLGGGAFLDGSRKG